MPAKTAKLFVNGGSQAVRLPAEFRFEEIRRGLHPPRSRHRRGDPFAKTGHQYVGCVLCLARPSPGAAGFHGELTAQRAAADP